MPAPRSSSHSKPADTGLNHFIFGSDAYLVEATRNKLVRSIREREQEELPLEKTDLEEFSLDNLLAAAMNLPLFAPRQIIHVRGVMKLREPQARRLADYFQSPSPATFLIFTAGALDRDDRKKKIYEILLHGTKVTEVVSWSEPQIRSRIEARLKNAEFQIEDEALRFLLETQGSDLGRLSNELDKLTLLAGEKKGITLEMVTASLGYCREHSVFEFIDAVAAKDRIVALRLTQELMCDSSQALQVISLLHRLLRQFLQMKELPGNVSLGEMARQIGMYGVPLSAVERRLQQSKSFSASSLALAIQRLGMLDDRIKSSAIDTKIFVEQLIYDLAC